MALVAFLVAFFFFYSGGKEKEAGGRRNDGRTRVRVGKSSKSDQIPDTHRERRDASTENRLGRRTPDRSAERHKSIPAPLYHCLSLALALSRWLFLAVALFFCVSSLSTGSRFEPPHANRAKLLPLTAMPAGHQLCLPLLPRPRPRPALTLAHSQRGLIQLNELRYPPWR